MFSALELDKMILKLIIDCLDIDMLLSLALLLLSLLSNFSSGLFDTIEAQKSNREICLRSKDKFHSKKACHLRHNRYRKAEFGT